MFSPETLLYALLGGILPVLLWLWFWLKEDAHHPEPRGLIMLSFIAGMAVIAIAIPLEKLAYNALPDRTHLLIAWAVIEEMLKFAAVLFVAIRSRFFDEPADALVYMITAALGFAAIENTLFLLAPFANGEFATGVMTGNLRYVGAALLHTAASGAVGIALGLAYYHSRAMKIFASIIGLSVAIALHALFNFFIIKNSGANMFIVFLHLWIIIVIVIFFFERLKRMMRVTYLPRTVVYAATKKIEKSQ
ncbi:MAG: PrsW family glutamic-type intramembrane protease [Patescibacteria group bacterium]